MPRRIVNTCSMRLTQSLAYPPPKLRVFDLVGLPPCIIGVFYKNCAGPYLGFSTEFAQGLREKGEPMTREAWLALAIIGGLLLFGLSVYLPLMSFFDCRLC